jgi:hypothetical protein
MKPFFASLALRIKKGQSGLAGNEITFETEGCARDLQAALNDLGIPCAVVQVGRQYKVRIAHLAAGEAGSPSMDQLVKETPPPQAAPAEIPSPAPINGAANTAKPAQTIPKFIPKASEPAPAAEKRRRFAELAKQEHVETARKLAEEQAQLELSFSASKGKRKPSKRPERP